MRIASGHLAKSFPKGEKEGKEEGRGRKGRGKGRRQELKNKEHFRQSFQNLVGRLLERFVKTKQNLQLELRHV